MKDKILSLPAALRAKLVGHKVTKLEAENKKLKQKLYESVANPDRPVSTPSHVLENANDEELQRIVREAHQEGTLFETAQTLAAKKVQHDLHYTQALLYALKAAGKHGKEVDHKMRERLLPAFYVSQLPERFARGMEEGAIPSLAPVVSFRGLITTRVRRKQLGHQLPEWKLDNKELGYRFAKKLDIPVPHQHKETYQLKELPLKPGTVIKPQHGAGGRGVYLLLEQDHYVNAKTSEKLLSKEELLASMQEDLQTGAVQEDTWMAEELYFYDKAALEPARDIKFYCFYGKAVLILEIRRYPELGYCWWTADGKQVETGKYTEHLFTGNGVSAEELEVAEKMSKEIPAPFCRIDFLLTDEGPVFGEFTPKPGNYDHFDEATDTKLGEAFLEAEENLFHDIWQGKKFEKWRELQ
ncbi:ATP-grasp fold amidoligase family protein [Alkalicoccus daliensis]|uniref:TupA-like ATPgrasp n=1 Tax=Alkalicoccus daliensis TaxID=745820 RepID=A0A1H0GIM9_9BACI|nr:ATP-grasp fold amidoligase family protein [Alkalicoccus daliensis]SDO06734.1 TupA-like ATPgrasp [Alkalicoccus daliensis]